MNEISLQTVKQLIQEQFPQWSTLPITPVEKSGHDNRTFHLGETMLIRLPSGSAYEPQVKKEARWLPYLEKHLTLPIPHVIANGTPSNCYPYAWSINQYIQGEIASHETIQDLPTFAHDLAQFLKQLQSIDTQDAPAAGAHNFFRGANPDVYHTEVEAACLRYQDRFPIQKIKEIWNSAIASSWQKPGVWIHGDVAPNNLLVENGQLCAVLDFGIMGIGDPACDYAMAWTFFDAESRAIFLQDVDEDTIARAKGWALWKALITCEDANAEIATNAMHTIQEILQEYDASLSQNTPVLETERLILRRFTQEDLPALFAILKDKETNVFLPWFPVETIEETKQFYLQRYANVYAKAKGYAYAICQKEDNIPIGYIKVDRQEPYDLGYGLRKEYWQKGYATEAATALLAQLKQDDLPYITATHDQNNPRSGMVMQKLGMQYGYSYEEQWQPKNIPVIFRMYQLQLQGETSFYMGYWERYKHHFIEEF